MAKKLFFFVLIGFIFCSITEIANLKSNSTFNRIENYTLNKPSSEIIPITENNEISEINGLFKPNTKNSGNVDFISCKDLNYFVVFSNYFFLKNHPFLNKNLKKESILFLCRLNI